MELSEPLNRSLLHLEGLVKALDDGLLRRQLESQISDLMSHLTGLLSANRVLEDQNRCLLQLSRRDEVTELYNQRHLAERLDEEYRRAVRYRTPLSLLLADLDDFKVFNDVRGHLVGNRLLRRVGRVIRQTIRDTDVAARCGGDEFAILLPQTGEDQAAFLAERLRAAVGALPEGITASVGVASLTSTVTGSLELLSHADRAMYRAKAEGKNRVMREARARGNLAHN